MTTDTRPAPTPMGGFLRVPGVLWAALDGDGVVRRCSGGVRDVLGLAPTAVVGRRALLLVDRADLSVAAAAAARVMAGDEVTGVVLRIRHADGRWRRVRLSARRSGDGLVHVVGRDVTAWRQAQERADAHELLVRSLLDHMPMPMFVKDMAGAYRFVNRAFCRLAGFPGPDDVVDRRVEELWPDVRHEVARHEAAVLAGDDLGAEERVATSEGVRDFIVVRRVLGDVEGLARAIAGVAIDITDRVSAEERLAERGRVLDAILATSPDVIAILDRGGQVVRHNAALSGMLGYRRQQVQVDDVLSSVHPDDIDALSAAFVDLMNGVTEQAVARYRLRHQQGHWVTVDSRARIERAADGRMAGMVIVTRDVTADLASETRLRAAVITAEEASRAKSEFLSRMSHELRTPLNSILGFAQLLQMDSLSDGQAGDVDGILRAGRQLLALVDEVLDIARIETGHLELQSEPVGAAAALGGVAGPWDVVTVADGVERVWADPRRLDQVLGALAAAARQAWGGPLSLSAIPAAPGWVRLSVAPARDRSRRSGARGQQLLPVGSAAHDAATGAPTVDGPAAEAPPGRFGIALALARYLVEQMGGRLDESAGPHPGFDVDVPAHLTASTAEGRPGPGPGPLRVVVVSADPAVGGLVAQAAARRPGVEVSAVADVDRALPLVEMPAVGVLLVDVRSSAGSPVLDALSRQPPRQRPVVVVLGADDPGRSVRRLLDGGADAYLAAPLDVRAVLDLIDTVRDAAPRG